MGFFNKLAHLGIGVWIGSGINDSRYRHGLYATLITFLAYQAFQIKTKGDEGYNEVRELGIGLAIPFIWRRAQNWLSVEGNRDRFNSWVDSGVDSIRKIGQDANKRIEKE